MLIVERISRICGVASVCDGTSGKLGRMSFSKSSRLLVRVRSHSEPRGQCPHRNTFSILVHGLGRLVIGVVCRLIALQFLGAFGFAQRHAHRTCVFRCITREARRIFSELALRRGLEPMTAHTRLLASHTTSIGGRRGWAFVSFGKLRRRRLSRSFTFTNPRRVSGSFLHLVLRPHPER